MFLNRRQKKEAFEEVVNHYEAALLRYATRLTANPDTAQDVVQNAFIKLFKRWQEKMAPSARISSWLYRVAHNEAVDHIRKESRRQELHQKQSAETPNSAKPDRGYNPGLSDGAIRARQALDSLSDRDKQVVILKVYEEMSYKAISAITGLKTGHVGYILHHALKRLAKTVKELEDHEKQSANE